MSLFRPSDPVIPPADPSRADRRAAGLTGTVSAGVLWALQTYVWHGAVPDPVAIFVWTVVPYALSQVAGHISRYRRLMATHKADVGAAAGSAFVAAITGGPPAAGGGPVAPPADPTTPGVPPTA